MFVTLREGKVKKVERERCERGNDINSEYTGASYKARIFYWLIYGFFSNFKVGGDKKKTLKMTS